MTMYPIVLTIGNMMLYSFSLFLVLSWLVFSFLFWRALRAGGTEEDRIFDLTFYATLVAFVVSRIAFVAFHWDLFADTWLKIFALWVQPGLSLYGALIGGLATLVVMSRSQKVRLGLVLDAFAAAFPVAFFIGLIGAFLDGSPLGKMTSVPWGIRLAEEVGKRHPVALYEMAAILFVFVFITALERRSARLRRPYGIVGVWFFLIYSVLLFILEFFKESRVYWISLSANQWVLVAIFAEAMGAFYVRGGGRESLRPALVKMKSVFQRFVGGIYAKFSK